MIEKLIDIIEKEGLSLAFFFVLYKKYKGIESAIVSTSLLESLEKEMLIKITSDGFNLRQLGIDIVERIERKYGDFSTEVKELQVSKKSKKREDILISLEINKWINEYRELFRGTKPGAMGDKGGCLNRMIKFFNEYPEFADKDIILKATQNYIDEQGVQNNYKFLQQAHYFIYKQTGLAKDSETSRLAAYCEEVDDTDTGGFTKQL